MGFYVKNKGMPENCMMCGFYRAGIGCVITRTLFNPLTNVATRQSNCPLIEIPPHGRLIDADALKEAFCGNCFADEKPMECSEPCMDMRIILETPTIIPAEEGE